jgi:hypothetical protein
MDKLKLLVPILLCVLFFPVQALAGDFDGSKPPVFQDRFQAEENQWNSGKRSA